MCGSPVLTLQGLGICVVCRPKLSGAKISGLAWGPRFLVLGMIVVCCFVFRGPTFQAFGFIYFATPSSGNVIGLRENQGVWRIARSMLTNIVVSYFVFCGAAFQGLKCV